jgi:hypothetical protein
MILRVCRNYKCPDASNAPYKYQIRGKLWFPCWVVTTLPVLNLMAASNIGDALVNWVDIDEIDFERPFFF